MNDMPAGQGQKAGNIVQFPEKGFVCPGKVLLYARFHKDECQRLFDVFKLELFFEYEPASGTCTSGATGGA